MILSVSRRTDIPNYYSQWFLNRLKEGFLYVRNPMNAHQVSEIALTPDVVECIVFWTKNPGPMIGRLDELKDYPYYFQFTLTGYGPDVECNVPHKKDVMIPVFQKLSDKIGKEKVVWRYDPIFFTKRYTPQYHLKAFGQIAHLLNGYTRKCVISFVDLYLKNSAGMASLGAYEISQDHLLDFAGQLSRIASENGMEIASCAERIDLQACGIQPNSCIDQQLIETMLGCKIDVRKDKNQRTECRCVESVEVGAYNTCKNGCKYCYANASPGSVIENCRNYDPASPLLCGTVQAGDRVSKRKVKSIKENQFCFLGL